MTKPTLGNIVAAAEEKLSPEATGREGEGALASDLQALVARATAEPVLQKPKIPPAMPPGYHDQVATPHLVNGRKPPVIKDTREKVINLRVTEQEKARFQAICVQENLSMPNCLIYFLDMYEQQNPDQ